MKRLYWNTIIIFLTIVVANVSAIETSLKDNYHPGETIIAAIEGNFLSPLTKESISFYSGRIQIPLLYEIAKIEDKYYLSIQLQSQQRNYSLRIKDAHFIEEGIEKSQDLEFNFSVSGNITDFSIDQGFVIAANDFSIKIQSKSKSVVATAAYQNTTKSITVPAGQTREMHFSVKEFPPLSFLEISSPSTKYLIPVKIITLKNNSNQSLNTSNVSIMEFAPQNLSLTLLKNSKTSFTILLKNIGTTSLQNITLNASEEVELSPSTIAVLQPAEVAEINATISLQEGSLFSFIRASSQETTAQMQLYVTATENQTEVVIPTPSLESCTILGGKICSPEETCKGNLLPSQEGKCCKGSCEIPQTESNTARYIAIAVITFIILLIIAFAWRKSRAKKKAFKDIMQEKNKSFEEKIHPKTEGEEVKGKLTKT